jgi:hypothetical protein
MLRRAAEADQHEDQLLGDARGDELPEALASKAGRLARLRRAKAQLEAKAAARRQAYQQRVAAHAAAAKAKGSKPRTLKPRPQEAPNPKATANVTDRDSRFLSTRKGSVQGYNAQAVTTLHQLDVAAELTCEANDVHQLQPMLAATATTLAAAGIHERPEAALADAGYWSIDSLTTIDGAPELLIPPARHGRQGKPARTAKHRRPTATACGPRCAPSSPARTARPATPSAGRPSSRRSARSKSSRTPAGSCAAACAPARRSGSFCAAPTTCSSSGGTRPPKEPP